MSAAGRSLDQLLSAARAEVETLASTTNLLLGHGATDHFMSSIYQIGADLTREPSLKSSSELQTFIEETAPKVALASLHVEQYSSRATTWLLGEWVFDEWVTACRQRSAIEFLIDLYRGAGIDMTPQNLQDHDAMLKEKLESDRRSDPSIPPNLPPSHWWWWHPAEPPSRSRSTSHDPL